MPMRADSSGAPLTAFLELMSESARWIESAALHGPLGVVLLRPRIAEERHQPVAEPLQHMAAEPAHRVRRLVEIGVDEAAPVFRVELRGEARRADEVAEHHGNRAALGGDFRGFGGVVPEKAAAHRLGRRRRRQCGDRGEQHAPVAYGRDADLLQVLDRQVREDRLPDPVVAKRSLIFAKAETAKPPADVHGRAPHGIIG